MSSVKASFKNSRIYPRSATLTTVEDLIAVNGNAGPVTLVKAANAQRTILSIENESTTDDIRYMAGNTPPLLATILTDGFLIPAGSSYDVTSPQNIYAISVTANPVNVSTDEGSG